MMVVLAAFVLSLSLSTNGSSSLSSSSLPLYGDRDMQALQHLPAPVLSICKSAQALHSISVHSIIRDKAESKPRARFFSFAAI